MSHTRCLSVVLAALAATIACHDREDGPLTPLTSNGAPPKPSFDHVAPDLTTQIAANNWAMLGDPIRLLFADYLTRPLAQTGSFAYGNSPQTTFLLDTYQANYFSGEGLPTQVSSPGTYADLQSLSLSMETDMPGRERTLLGLLTVRETFSFNNASDDDYVIVKYTLTNPTSNVVSGLYVSQIIDFDIVGSDRNTFGYDNSQSLAWASSTYTSLMGGQMVLGEPTTNYAMFSCCEGGPGSQARAGDFDAWFSLLSGGIGSSGPMTLIDMRNLVGTGPVTLAPGEARSFTFALVGGDGRTELSSHAAAARARYEALPEAARAPRAAVLAEVKVHPDVVSAHSARDVLVTLSFHKTGSEDTKAQSDHESEAAADGQSGVDDRADRESALAWLSCDGAKATRVLRADAHQVSAVFSSHALARAARPESAGGKLTCAGAFEDGMVFIGKADLHVRTVFVPVTQLTFNPASDHAPTWSPDGRSIAFSSNRSGGFALWRMNVADGETSAQQVTSALNDRTPDWFGNSIVFTRGSDIYTVSDAAVAGVPAATRFATVNGVRYPRYSPDGSQIAFDQFGVVVAKTPVAVPTYTLVADPFPNSAAHPEWSPDGHMIYFTHLGDPFDIFRVNADGGIGARATPLEAGGLDNRHAAVSPDGTTLAFLSGHAFTTEIVLQDLATGQHTPLALDLAVLRHGFADVVGLAQNLEFSPDGRKLVFQARGDIYVVDLARKRIE